MTVKLRSVEPQDLDFLLSIENNQNFWKVSETIVPFSRFQLEQFIENAHLDIYATKQFRFIIYQSLNLIPVGIIDYYDFDPKNKRVGIGIVIAEEEQGKGYAKQAIDQILNHAQNVLLVHQVYAKIHSSNTISIKCFENCGFKKTVVLKEWYFDGKGYEDELIFQKIITD